MSAYIEEIRNHEEVLQGLFAKNVPFSKNMNRWEDSVIYNMYDHNQFVVCDELTARDIEDAIQFQKNNNKNFLKIDSRTSLDRKLIQQFEFEEDITLTMLQKMKDSSLFKINKDVVIKDMQSEDIEADLLAIELQNYQETSGEEFIRLMISTYCKKAKSDPRFHFYGAYLENTICGICYAFEHQSFTLIDGLTVNANKRKQYVASTLIHFIMQHTKGLLYLHADKEDTPKEMYRKMGFEEIDVLYEYVKEFKV